MLRAGVAEGWLVFYAVTDWVSKFIIANICCQNVAGSMGPWPKFGKSCLGGSGKGSA